MADKHHLFAVTYWLLKAAALLLFVIMGAIVLGLIGLGIAAVVGFDPEVMADMGMSMPQIVRVGVFALLAALVCLVMLQVAVMLTTRIVESAMSGNPFVPENATRLTQIGWLMLAMEVAGMLVNMTLSYLLPEKIADDINFETAPVGLFGILLIFVMAQIFRHGTELRADLEGTV